MRALQALAFVSIVTAGCTSFQTASDITASPTTTVPTSEVILATNRDLREVFTGPATVASEPILVYCGCQANRDGLVYIDDQGWRRRDEVLRDYVKTFDKVGVGYYPNSHFVHMDVRKQWTYWVDVSSPGQRPRYAGFWTRRPRSK